MQHNVKSLSGFTIGATDGEIGEVEEFYFDDETWTIRYLVVKTGGWLSGRKVLLSPVALQQPDWKNKIFPVNLNKEQVKKSPDIDTKKTVSRQHEIALYDHYSWPYYGAAGAGFYGGMGMAGMVDSRIPVENILAEQQMEKEPADPHLRSTDEIRGYHIHATDGKIGVVEDFIFNDQTWAINYLIADTGSWLPGKKVILSPEWIKEVKWEDGSIQVDIPVDAVRHSPEYDPTKPLEEAYREKLHNYYGRSIN
ncbi:MAG: PRC-barrel domain-containing protein [Candidatus Pedobacter colombiensis]|uniref:PRC-barrel domain-containing protein n=1 Tax=Candidatus Pedobacter colombiensis TaxID=3121371 RepID=A0AAJ5WDQ1_9SPHI|nr:PRC-barrel domain-containing protein [Pedobacter sp.]WEK21584.1 MAG: PRC-barrel domain-containing protein [Pedobacter sp.]